MAGLSGLAASGHTVAAYCCDHGRGANLYRCRRIFEREAGETETESDGPTKASFVELRVVDAPDVDNDAGRHGRVRLTRMRCAD